MQQWVQLATAADGSHILMTYGQQPTGGLIYNLYADKLLQLDLVPQSVSSCECSGVFMNSFCASQVYNSQTSFLQKQAGKMHS